MSLSNEMIEKLMRDLKVTRAQAESTIAEKIITNGIDKNEQLLIQEAKNQVEECKQIIKEMRKEQVKIYKEVEEVCDSLTAIKDAEEKYGNVMSEKSKDLLATFACLFDICRKNEVSPTAAVDNISYMMYAMLGGQARQVILPNGQQNYEPQKKHKEDERSISKMKKYKDYDPFDRI